jgi:energy-coupling factor transporter ATP-binding protein EcfA2
MIESLHLRNYKGFSDFRVNFADTTVLVGPNNAGKSTCIEALRGLAAMIAHARRLKPDRAYCVDRDSQVRGYRFSPGELPIEQENLRHEFIAEETRLEARLRGGLGVTAVWPAEGEEESSFFYLTAHDRPQPRSPGEVRPLFHSMGVVPQLAPIERTEEPLSKEYLLKTVSSRLASRHFRNHLWEMKQRVSVDGRTGFEEFCEFAAPWLPEMQLVDVSTHPGLRGGELDVFYREGQTRKELVWAGDGVQVFLQIIWHVHRLAKFRTVILDEPDIYLHADLQRQVMRLLDTCEAQVIVATHSPEIVTEATPTSVVWLDRSRRRAVRSPEGKALEDLSRSIGTHFNLRLARVLRTKVAVFVEGDDPKLLRNLAGTIGAQSFVTEGQLTVVPLEGSTNRSRVTGFKWLVENLLESAIIGWIILDRDYRSDEETQALFVELEGAGLRPHIWTRHEIENYVLDPHAIARRSGAPLAWIDNALSELRIGMKDEVLPDFLATRQAEAGKGGRAVKTIVADCLKALNEAWADPRSREIMCPGKELLSHLNQRLQDGGFKSVTALGLSRELRQDEIDDEVKQLLLRVDRECRR